MPMYFNSCVATPFQNKSQNMEVNCKLDVLAWHVPMRMFGLLHIVKNVFCLFFVVNKKNLKKWRIQENTISVFLPFFVLRCPWNAISECNFYQGGPQNVPPAPVEVCTPLETGVQESPIVAFWTCWAIVHSPSLSHPPAIANKIQSCFILQK